MVTLVWRDVRLLGWRPNTPKNGKVMECNFDTPLQWFIDYSKVYSDEAKQKKESARLKIMAHGYYRSGSGGYGIQFCKENINLDSIARLAPLREKFTGGVEIYSCGAAAVTPGSMAGNGNGTILCRRIAMIMATTVRASDTKQLYGMGLSPTVGIDFGVWQGNVFTWDKNGKLIKTEVAPKQ